MYVLDKENAIKEGSNVVEEASLSSLSEFTNTPEYSPISDTKERDADSFVVDVECEVQTWGEGPVRTLMYKSLAHGAAYFGREQGMAHTNRLLRKLELQLDHDQLNFRRKHFQRSQLLVVRPVVEKEVEREVVAKELNLNNSWQRPNAWELLEGVPATSAK